MIQLGNKVRDPITGVRGTVVARTEYLHGEPRCQVQPKGIQNDGQPLAATWFAEAQLEENADE